MRIASDVESNENERQARGSEPNDITYGLPTKRSYPKKSFPPPEVNPLTPILLTPDHRSITSRGGLDHSRPTAPQAAPGTTCTRGNTPRHRVGTAGHRFAGLISIARLTVRFEPACQRPSVGFLRSRAVGAGLTRWRCVICQALMLYLLLRHRTPLFIAHASFKSCVLLTAQSLFCPCDAIFWTAVRRE